MILLMSEAARDIVTAAIGILAGIDVIAFVKVVSTLRQTKKGAEIENESKAIDNWQELTEEMHENEARLKEELREVRAENLELRERLGNAERHWAMYQVVRCEKINCTQRKPPLSLDAAIKFLNDEMGHSYELSTEKLEQ